MAQPNHSLDLFVQRLPRNPYCSNSLASEGLYRLPQVKALSRLMIQPNTANLHVCLCFDVDREGAAIDWQDRLLPPPNLSVMNPDNGHAHLIYLLSDPVPTSDLARIKPVQFMSAVQEGIRRTLDADRGYAGVIVKNPSHNHWRTTEHCHQPYALQELAEWVELPTPREMRKRNKDADYAGLGRNCTIFEIVRLQSYSLVRDYWRPGGDKSFYEAVLELVLRSNEKDIGNPLGFKECRAIAKSISRWTWRTFTPAAFREIQATRGRAKGASKRAELIPKAKAMDERGLSKRQIAKELGVSNKTVCNWLEQGV